MFNIIFIIITWLLIGFLGHLYWWDRAFGVDKEGIKISLIASILGIFSFFLGFFCYLKFTSKK